MTGIAFLLFTFYMITDPGTTPTKRINQIVFGAAVAFAYAMLLMFHLAFGLFFALVIVCASRGLGLYVLAVSRTSMRVNLELPQTSEPARALLREMES